ncbi:MAG: hypothetical protein JXX14_09475 [Deltaproteobacteria bacterium]|nr:hypothetical protein [Deltaproteobacteria bacterium]
MKMRLFPFLITTALAFLLTGACQSTVFVDDTSDSDEQQCAPQGTSPLVCENFESPVLPSSTQIRNGDVRFAQDIVLDGRSSLLCETDSVESFAFVSRSFTPITQGTIFFRVHIFIPQSTITGTTKVLNLTSYQSVDLEAVQSIDVNFSIARRVEIYQHGNQERYQSISNMVPENRWFCLSGSYTISEAAAETSISIDDSLAVSTIASAEAVVIGGVSEFRFGIGWTEQGQDTAVFYMDNVLVDTVPVDCATPDSN